MVVICEKGEVEEIRYRFKGCKIVTAVIVITDDTDEERIDELEMIARQKLGE